jgi:prevent-host-death family protein
MKNVGIKNLKNQLSQYLSYVKRGEDVLISERGRIIARIIQENPKVSSIKQDLLPLVRQGLIKFPVNKIEKDFPDPVRISGKPVSESVIEDRR